jgi:non-specific serine/threonine protein kinase
VLDVLVDADGVWTTGQRNGPGELRSLPIPGGMAPRRVWKAPRGKDLGPFLADRLDADVSPRVSALARLTAAVNAAAAELAVPLPDGRWRPAPGPAHARALTMAVEQCLATGLVVADDPADALQNLVDDLCTARIGTFAYQTPTSGRAATAWGRHVVARQAANTRIAVVLGPPEPDHWTVSLLAIRLDEPTTRIPLQAAIPEMFDAVGWDTWLGIEMEALRRAWGGDVPPLPEQVELGPAAVLEFIDRTAPRLERAGFDVIAPAGLLRPSPVRRRLSRSGEGSGLFSIEQLGLDTSVAIDGVELTAEDAIRLAASKSELVSVRGRWLRIGPRDAERLATLLRRLQRPITPADLLTDPAFEGIEMDAEQILPAGLQPARRLDPPAVRATLRPYQHVGLEWLTWLEDNGVGGILADDMGLGKTLQVLSLINDSHPAPTLVVCPVTLVDTWVRQAAQFTPELRVAAFHGADRGEVTSTIDADIVVTTYGLLARDESLAEVGWHRIVLDEAQAIKNPDTRAARAARALTATHRLIVTGTPVENHLGDLWSLMAFAQPGLLPRRKPFRDHFVNGDEAALARLRAVIGPFILRRTKTDPGILDDLPDREVIRDDCTLTREQAGAYEAVVADMLGTLAQLREGTTPGKPHMGRRGAVLAGISRLKQICVHPALLTESRRALGERSGKISRLVELCGQIVDEGQAVVVFTQFASFVPDLAAHLQEQLGVEVATLTGSDGRAARTRTVAAFSAPDGPPILIASLKAGGTGLTLVRANHVIHLDRWWNPAVEDQASDRVWRIGQNQKVSVHVLVCPGTIEDRIDQALAGKRSLASSVVRSTESAVTEMTDTELADLVALARDRILQ